MSKKKSLQKIAIISGIFMTAQATAEISANVALISDYIWRGVSQNNENLALQGGFDYEHENGFYIGTWGSNVSFGNVSTELDIYLGWTKELESGLELDIGAIQVTYHGGSGASDNNYKETYVGLSHSGFNVLYSIGYEFNNYYEVGYERSFDKLTVSTTYGDYDSYSYYKISFSGELGGIGLALDFWDTDSAAKAISPGLAGSRVGFTISKSF